MGVRLDRFRQVFNLFLTLALICVVAGVFVYFLTTPEQRKAVTFWMSMGLLFLAALVFTLFAARIVYSDSARQVPHTFAQLALISLYVVFVILASIANAFIQMTALRYFLLHVAGGFVILLPLQLTNMASLKSAGTRQAACDIKIRLKEESDRLNDLLDRIENERGKVTECLPPVRKLADNLLYSDPSPAPRSAERALEKALDELQVKGELVLSAQEKDLESRMQDLIRAYLAADRALKNRGEAIVRSK